MKLLLSFIVAAIAFALLYYHMFYIPLLPALGGVEFISFMVDRAGSVIPGFLGVWVGIYYSISDSFISFIRRPFYKLKSDWIYSNIVSGYAVVERFDSGVDSVDLEVSYAGVKRIFNIDRRYFDLSGIVSGSRIGVFYDRKNPRKGYLDLHSITSGCDQNHQDVQDLNNIKEYRMLDSSMDVVTQPNAVFKVTELSPRFEQKPNTYAITGEVIGGGFTGKTFTVEKIIPQQFLQHVLPGMVIPCHVDTSSAATKIIFSIHA